MASDQGDPGAPSYFRVLLLGPFALERDGVPIDVAMWQRRVSSLFKLLATAPDYRCMRDDLIDALWPETSPEAGTSNLRTVAHRLRISLGGGEPLPVLAEHGWIALNSAYRWEVDLRRFEVLAETAGDDVSSLERALALYRAEPLLEERYEDWAISIRERLQNLWRDLCLRLAVAYQVEGASGDAVRILERVLEADPVDEEAIRALLTALYTAGRPADALRRYHQFEQRLADEIGVLPSGETMAVVQQLHARSAPARAEARQTVRPLPIGGFLGAVPEGPMVAREEELKRILLVADVAEQGTGQVVLVSGEQGVGKTRLAQEVMLDLRARGFAVATGRCYERERDVSLYPFFEAVERAFEDAHPFVQHEMARRWPSLMAAFPKRAQLDRERGAASIAPNNATNYKMTPLTTRKPLDPQEKYGLFREITALFIAVAQDKPVAVLLDDLQWADEVSLGLLQHLASHTRGHRVLLLGNYRDPAADRDQPLGRALRELAREGLVERVSLRRLPPEGTASLVTATVGEMDASEEFAEFVHRRTKGNPFFIHEMLEALGGRYCLVRYIGSGGMGRVFEAIDTETGNTVAAKTMFARTEADPKAVLRFEQEGATLARLEHPNIVQVYGTFLTEHVNFIIMELLEGRSLRTILHQEQLSLHRIKRLMEQVAAALVSAHGRGIVHRDIKPDNIMVLPGDQVKVTDFGIARLIRPRDPRTTLTSTGMTLGTPLYMAPEQIEGRSLDGRADIYALGAVLYQLVTGRPPFDGHDPISIAFKHVHEAPQPPKEVNADVPEDWNQLILKALAKDPADRFQTAASLGQALSSLGVTSEPSAAGGREHDLEPALPPDVIVAGGKMSGEAREEQPPPVASVVGPTTRRTRRDLVHSPTRILGGVAAAVLLAAAGIFAALTLHSALNRSAQITIWGAKGSLPGQFDQPMGVTVDTRGAIYVADSMNDRIQKIPRQGRAAKVVWGGRPSAPGSLFRPHDVAVDPQGDVYVADLYHDRIQEFTRSGKVLVKGVAGSDDGQFLRPTGITLDADGNVYVADSLNSRIQKLSPSLAYRAQWTVPGPNPSVQSRPSDLAVDREGNMYVADFQNNRIVKISPTGKILPIGGTPGTQPVQFLHPASVALDTRGNLYVADSGNSRIAEVSPTGKLMMSWGHPGSGSGELKSPGDIVLDHQGNIYVADSQNNRIQKFSPSGSVVETWGAKGPDSVQLDNPEGIAVDGSGTIYVADTANDVVRRLSPTGRQLPDLGILNSRRLSSPHGVAVDALGTIYVADSNHDRIEEISSHGIPLSVWGTDGSGPGQLNDPQGIAVDQAGNLYVADTGNNRIQELQTGRQRTWHVIGLFSDPSGIALDGHGHIYVAEAGSNRVQILSTEGKTLRTWEGSRLFKAPGAIAVDRVGNVYVADTGNNRIQEFSSSGTLIHRWGTMGSGAGQFRDPAGVALDRRGNIVVADTGNNRIQQISRSSS